MIGGRGWLHSLLAPVIVEDGIELDERASEVVRGFCRAMEPRTDRVDCPRRRDALTSQEGVRHEARSREANRYEQAITGPHKQRSANYTETAAASGRV